MTIHLSDAAKAFLVPVDVDDTDADVYEIVVEDAHHRWRMPVMGIITREDVAQQD